MLASLSQRSIAIASPGTWCLRSAVGALNLTLPAKSLEAEKMHAQSSYLKGGLLTMSRATVMGSSMTLRLQAVAQTDR